MPMKDFAKRQLEKYGWKEGEGLGREKQGKTDHVKVQVRGDEVGIGYHEAMHRAGGDLVATELDMALKAIPKKRKKKEHAESADDEEPAGSGGEENSSDGELKKTKGRVGGKRERDDDAVANSSSDSSSSDDEDEDEDGFGTSQSALQLDDKALFKACNGVRLGRGSSGRHRHITEGKQTRFADRFETGDKAKAAVLRAGYGGAKTKGK